MAGTSGMLYSVCVPQWGKDNHLAKQSMHRPQWSPQLVKTGHPVPARVAEEECLPHRFGLTTMVQLGGRTAAPSEVVAVSMSLWCLKSYSWTFQSYRQIKRCSGTQILTSEVSYGLSAAWNIPPRLRSKDVLWHLSSVDSAYEFTNDVFSYVLFSLSHVSTEVRLTCSAWENLATLALALSRVMCVSNSIVKSPELHFELVIFLLFSCLIISMAPMSFKSSTVVAVMV